MAHQFQTGVFLHGTPAWHSLGHVLDGTLPAREAFRLAEADFAVEAQPIYTATGEQIPGHNAIVRLDTNHALSVMTTRYRPIQNEQLIRLAEATREHIDMDAVVVLDEGRKVSFTGKIRANKQAVRRSDEIVQYLVGCTSHDGSVAFSVMFSPVRVVCANTMASALHLAEAGNRGKKRRMSRIRHTANAAQMIERLPEIMDFAGQTFTATVEELEVMAKTPCLAAQFNDFCRELYADQLAVPINDVRGDSSTERPRQLDDLPVYHELTHKFSGGAIGGDMPHMRGTMYAAYQAVAEFYSHDAGRTNDDPVEAARKRLESLWFGPGAKRIDSARTLALAAAR